VSTRRGTRCANRGNSVGPSHARASRARVDSTVTVLAIEQGLSELGTHASLSDVVARARSIENRIIQWRSRRKPEQMC
jgi:hypothetical protein